MNDKEKGSTLSTDSSSDECLSSDEDPMELSKFYSTESYPLVDFDPNQLKFADVFTESKSQNSSLSPTLREKTILKLYEPLSHEYSPKNDKLLAKKINICCIIFDFSNPESDLKNKEIKRQTLLDLIDFTHYAGYDYLSLKTYQLFFKLISENIFRNFPTVDEVLNELEDEEQYFESSWPHISLVYKIFINIIESENFNVDIASQIIDTSFISRIIELFDTRDLRERSFLKNIMYSLYTKMTMYRYFSRQYMCSIFHRNTYDEYPFRGISFLLEIYSSIINGFSIPVKDEHLICFGRIFLPLHTSSNLYLFHENLLMCILFFVSKEISLSKIAIEYLVRHFPNSSSHTRILILIEIEKIVCISLKEIRLYANVLFNFLSNLLNDPHFQLSERAIAFTKYLLIDSKLPIESSVFLRMYNCAKETKLAHWNKNVNKVASNLLDHLSMKIQL